MPKFEELGQYVEIVWKTQGALAKRLGVSNQTVSQWINKKLRVTEEFRDALSNLDPPYDGPFPEPGENGITRDDLEQFEKKIEGLIHWALRETKGEIAQVRTDLQALGIGQAAIQNALEELISKKRA